MKKILRKGKKVLLLGIVIIISGLANLSIKLIPFKSIVRYLTNSDVTKSFQLNEKQGAYLRVLKTIIIRTKRIVPWRVLCYEQAIIVLVFSRLWKINMEIVFGVSKDENNELIAHAWTQSGELIVTGGESLNSFTPIYNRYYVN